MKTMELLLPKGLDTEEIVKKTTEEITAMGYKTSVEQMENEFIFSFEKDTSILDMFLGRWQKQKISFVEKNRTLHLKFYGEDRADKIVCFTVGIIFFFLPYIFGLIALANRKNTLAVAKKTIEDYITKHSPEKY